jgi:hypothetical protein
MSNGTQDPNIILPKEKLDYAWKWFAYHAGQRLTAFNFLLVLSAGLSVAMSKAYEIGAYEFILITSAFGAFAALGFTVLDWRNKELVELGHKALRSIEKSSDFSESPAACQLSNSDLKLREQSDLKRHSFWLPAMGIVLTTIFTVATLFSGFKVWEKHCHKRHETQKTQTYYQCPTLNKNDETQSWPAQSRRTRES